MAVPTVQVHVNTAYTGQGSHYLPHRKTAKATENNRTDMVASQPSNTHQLVSLGNV